MLYEEHFVKIHLIPTLGRAINESMYIHENNVNTFVMKHTLRNLIKHNIMTHDLYQSYGVGVLTNLIEKLYFKPNLFSIGELKFNV